MSTQVIFEVQLPARLEKKGKYYVSYCPALDIYSQGETKRKALANLVEALQLFLISCYERGTLDQVLRNCGWKPIQETLVSTLTLPDHTYQPITVPLPFMIDQSVASRLCHA